ncbi:nucleotidyltransferase domain-containing protein [Serpentinimonas raichei]|uniref:nucleotidyltransferase domain-containing protein n=1 Tax=Serpentinimonas raichei TaxID=1458425 RepID=UPI003B848899
MRALLQQHIPEAGVWAYGSRVRGDHYPASDLDLVVCFPSDSPRRPPKVLHLWPPKLLHPAPADPTWSIPAHAGEAPAGAGSLRATPCATQPLRIIQLCTRYRTKRTSVLGSKEEISILG